MKRRLGTALVFFCLALWLGLEFGYTPIVQERRRMHWPRAEATILNSSVDYDSAYGEYQLSIVCEVLADDRKQTMSFFVMAGRYGQLMSEVSNRYAPGNQVQLAHDPEKPIKWLIDRPSPPPGVRVIGFLPAAIFALAGWSVLRRTSYAPAPARG